MVLFLDLTWLKQLQHGSPQKEEAQFSLFIYLFFGLFKRILFEWFLQRLLQYESHLFDRNIKLSCQTH